MKSIDYKEKQQEHLRDAKSLVELAREENRELTDEEETQVSNLMKEAEKAGRRALMIGKLEEAGESRGRVYQPEGPELPKETRTQWSILRAARLMAANKTVDGLEGEVNAELTKQYGREPRGVWMPMSFDTRATVLDSTQGTGAVPTVAQGFIDMLRNRLVVVNAGATVLSDLSGAGQIDIPRQTGAATAYVVGESTDTTASNQTIGTVNLNPFTVGAYTDVSRHFLLQSSISAEQFVRNDLARVLALKIDQLALDGTGTTEPTGILQGSGGTVTCGDSTNGGRLVWSKVIEFETEAAVDNADVGTLAYVTNPKVRGWLKGHDIAYVDGTGDPATGRMMWGSDNSLNGYPIYVSNQMPGNLTVGSTSNCSTMIFGNWADLILGFWSGLDIIVDQASLSKQGGLRIVALQDFDTVVRHDESHVFANDINTA